MKLIINKTDFSGLRSALYYTEEKHIPRWFYYDTFEEIESYYGILESDLGYVEEESELPGVRTVGRKEAYRVGKEKSGYIYAYAPSLYSGLDTSTIEVDKEGYKSTQISYYGNTDLSDMADFVEYKATLSPEKQKYNASLKVTYLNDQSKILIGKDIDSVMKAEKTLFPSYTKETSTLDYGFFGSTMFGSSRVLVLDVPENVTKIELYEEIIESGKYDYDYSRLVSGSESVVVPVISIYLGPNGDESQEPSENYYIEPGTRHLGSNYSSLVNEKLSRKIVWLDITDSSNIATINLSAKFWMDSINSEKNKYLWDLRNDEYYGTRRKIGVISEKQSFYVDGRNNSLLGNKTISAHPILDSKLASINQSNYSPYRRYNKHDTAKFNNIIWVSLVDGNVGNKPGTSQEWIEENSLTDYYTSRVSVIPGESGSGQIIPSGQVTVKDGDTKKFIVIPGLGREFSDCGGVSYTKSESTVYTESGERVTRTVISISNWSTAITSGQVVFNFSVTPSPIQIKTVYAGGTKDYTGTEKFYEDEVLTLEGVVSSASVGDTVSLMISGFTKNKVSKVKKEYRVTDLTQTDYIEVESGKINDTVDYSECTYYFYIEPETIVINTVGANNIEVESGWVEVVVDQPYTYNFYPTTEDTGFKVSVTGVSREIEKSEFTTTGTTIDSITCKKVGDIYKIIFSKVTSNITINYDN